MSEYNNLWFLLGIFLGASLENQKSAQFLRSLSITGFLNCVIFLLCTHKAQLHLLCVLVILCNSGRDEYFLHSSCFPEKLKILEGNWFFSSALSLHKYSQGSQSSLGDDLCFIVTAEPRQMQAAENKSTFKVGAESFDHPGFCKCACLELTR